MNITLITYQLFQLDRRLAFGFVSGGTRWIGSSILGRALPREAVEVPSLRLCKGKSKATQLRTSINRPFRFALG
jgi:hypothetical protein